MATVNKDFKIKNGLIVEGASATVNGNPVLTETASDAYIINLIDGETLVKSVSNEFDVSAGGELSIDRTTVDAYYDAAGTAASQAGSIASDLTDHENATVAHGATGAVVGTTNTQTLTNKTIGDTLNFTGAGNMTISSDSHIVFTPAAGSSVKWGADVLATQAYADEAEADAIDAAETYTDGREAAITTAYEAYADQAEADAITTANAYTDTEIAALVDSAPALLDTLNELAAAIGDDANFATTLTTSVGTKVSKAGDTMTGLLVLSADPSANLGAATKQYVDTAASTAESNAESYADGLAANYDAAGSASAAQSAAITSANSYTDGRETAITTAYQGYADQAEADAKTYADGLDSTTNDRIDDLTTSDIPEGSNDYFTDARAKTSAADLLTGPATTLTNITITGNGSGLTITAENGVADSDTDDLDEGTANLYFTDARAVDALEAVVPNFTAVEVNSVAKQVAAEASVATASINTAVSWAKADYRSAEFLVKIASGSHTEVSKVILTLDTSDNVAITEYAIVGTNGDLGSVSADISGADVRLRVTTANNNSTVAVVGTLIK